ncbi:MAG: hypothetical protein MUE81_22675 [Thermoflexibacter sp.]|jgi:hypothetical protein|nr:hypothetical protein [Thermoflexibacter sp.]
MEKRFVEYLQDVLISIHENIHEARERKNFADKDELDYIEGKLMAYNEVLAILRMSAKEFDIPSAEIGL